MIEEAKVTVEKLVASGFERLADHIHENGITQLIGEGSSASPFVRLAKLAYKKRYGEKARRLKVVNLGLIGSMALDSIKGGAEVKTVAPVIASRRKIDASQKSLLITEVVDSGFSLKKTSDVLKNLGVEHTTCSLIKYGNYKVADFVPDVALGTYLMRGKYPDLAQVVRKESKIVNRKRVDRSQVNFTNEDLNSVILQRPTKGSARRKVNDIARELEVFRAAIKHVQLK